MTTPRSYIEKEFNDEPDLGPQRTSSFRWDDVFGGFENGKVFAVPKANHADYKEMLDTDGKASSLEKMLSYPIIAAPWEIDPAKDPSGDIGPTSSIINSSRSDEIVSFIYDALTDLPHQGGPRTTIEELISQMTMAFTYEKTFFEKCLKVNDKGKVVYDKIAWVPPETCELALDAKTGDLRGFRHTPVTWGAGGSNFLGGPATNNQGYKDIDMDKAFIYIHGTWRDPVFGFSSMQVPYWCYVTKRKLRWLWYQFLDQTYLPKTVVKNPDDRQAISDAKKVATLRSRGVVGLNSQTTVEPFESSGHGSAGYIEAIRFLDSEMSHSILAGFMDLTSQAAEGKGSYALSESQGKLFLRTRRMVARDMARQITNHVIGPLVRYNFGNDAPCPRFAFGPLSEQNEQAVLDMFKAISTTGAKVPPEFFDQLTVRVSTLLELDPGKVKKNMEQMPETPGELGMLGAQVDVATAMVDGAQQKGLIPPSPIGPPPGGRSTAPGSDSVANKGSKSSTARKANQ